MAVLRSGIHDLFQLPLELCVGGFVACDRVVEAQDLGAAFFVSALIEIDISE
jgi:hypothetical protein